MNGPLVGTWQLISETREGMAVFTEANFSIHVSGKSLNQDEPSRAMLEVNQTMQLSGGTYTILGSKAILKYGLSGVPDYIGRDLELDFSIEGDTMIIRGTQPDGSTTEETTWRRLGNSDGS